MTGLLLLFEDERIAAFAKPSGLLVHRGMAADAVTAVDLARETLGRVVHPVHRLDRGTSGVLLFAKDSATAAELQRELESGRAEKRYIALVRGVTAEEAVVDHPIPKSEGGPRVPAVTLYRRLHVFERYSVVEAFPRTGRFHQVRRHMKHAGHPLVGDVNYGKGDINRMFRERFDLHRLALHAARLTISLGGATHAFEAAIPDDLAIPLAAMGFVTSSP